MSTTGGGGKRPGGSLRHSLRGFSKRARAGLSEVLELLNEDGSEHTGGGLSQFGTDLGEWMAFQKSLSEHVGVPYVTDAMLRYLTHHGLAVQGLFRMSGSLEYTQLLRGYADVPNEIEFAEGTSEYAHVVAGLLKMFLRELPGSLMDEGLIDAWLGCTEVSTSSISVDEPKTAAVLRQLSPDRQTLLTHILRLLHLVSTRSDENKMTSENLATCLAPSLIFRGSSSSADTLDASTALAEIARLNALVRKLIERANDWAPLQDIPPLPLDTPATAQTVAPPERQSALGSGSSGSLASSGPAGVAAVRPSPLKRTVSQLLTQSPQKLVGSAVGKRLRKDSSRRRLLAGSSIDNMLADAARGQEKRAASSALITAAAAASCGEMAPEDLENVRPRSASTGGGDHIHELIPSAASKFNSSRLNSPLMRKRAHTDVRSIFSEEGEAE